MGTTEIVFILVVYLLLFGAKGMPSLARSLGSAVRQFRSATDEIQREILQTGGGRRETGGERRETGTGTGTGTGSARGAQTGTGTGTGTGDARGAQTGTETEDQNSEA